MLAGYNQGIENFIIFEGRDTNYIEEGLQNPVYRGKNSSVLRFGCEILKWKNTQLDWVFFLVPCK